MKILSYEECKKELSDITTYADNDIKLDIGDLDIVAKDQYLLVMGVSEYSGASAGKKAIKAIILDLEENELSLKEADGVLVHFKMNTNHPIMELADAIELINDRLFEIELSNEPSLIWGLSCDENMKEDCVKATVFISYFLTTR